MGVYFNTVKKLKEGQDMVDVYRDEISSESLTGVISNYSEELIYLSLFTDEGLPNGVAIFFITDITRIRWGGNVRNSISKLISLNGSRSINREINLSSLKAAIESVQLEFGYVNLLAERIEADITFIGEVSEIDEEALVLNSYGTMSTLDRSFQFMALNSISRIDAGANYENCIHLLLNDKKS